MVSRLPRLIAGVFPPETEFLDQIDFVGDDNDSSLRLLQRNPADLNKPLTGFRVHIRCSDCVAGLDVEAVDWSGFMRLFSTDYESCVAADWISPAGEWQLRVGRDDSRGITVNSRLDSLLDCHRWWLETRFTMSVEGFNELCNNLKNFIGVWNP